MRLFILSGLIATALAFGSCTSTKEIMDSWLGHTKHDLAMKWGPPARTAPDGNGGEILVYANQVYIPASRGITTANTSNGTTSTGPGRPAQTYWDYKMMFVNKEGKIYHWLTQRQQIPPQQIDLNVYFRN